MCRAAVATATSTPVRRRLLRARRHGPAVVRLGVLLAPKGCDKSGVAARRCVVRGVRAGTVRWVGQGRREVRVPRADLHVRPGEPMGRVVKSPFIRIMATEEEQTGNVFDTIYFNLTSNSSAPLFELQAYGLNPGLKKACLPAAARSARPRRGQHRRTVASRRSSSSTSRTCTSRRSCGRCTGRCRRTSASARRSRSLVHRDDDDVRARRAVDRGGDVRVADAIEEGRARRPRLLFNHRWGEISSLRDPAKPSTEESRRSTSSRSRKRSRGVRRRDRVELGRGSDRRRFDTAAVRGGDAPVLLQRARAYRELVDRDGGLDVQAAVATCARSSACWASTPGSRGRGMATRSRSASTGRLTNDATALVGVPRPDRYLFPL
jgi:hypothetical protein